MRRWLPRSLGGQMALLMGLALLFAQLVNFTLILNERQKLSLAQNQGPAITRFASVAADVAQASPEFRDAIVADASHRGARFALAAAPGLDAADRDAEAEARVRAALGDVGLGAAAIVAGTPAETRADRRDARPDSQLLRIAIRQPDGRWLAARLITPRRDPWLAARLGAATLLVYLIVLGATVWIAMRLARPLRDLTRAADAFAGRTAPTPVAPRGPEDLRRAIEAFNAMNLRVLALIDEKDRMLGAIGHDLRTPLASLRIRLESMDPETERAAAIAKVGELAAMLEDILALARTGRAREQGRAVDVAALADLVAESFADLGHDVIFAPSTRAIATVQDSSLKRAIRNLIDNALKYAGAAEVRVETLADAIAIRVVDRGPGIPADERDRVLQPFYRLEASRNRETGGSGLGLAIAQGIAESHGGRLELTETRPHGLTATILLPGA